MKKTAVIRFLLIGGLFFAASLASAQQKSIAKTLHPIIVEQGVEKAIDRYHELKKEKPEAYNFAEQELNQLGYQLIGEKRLPEAKAILKLNTELFPKSPNAFDSYGEILFKLDEIAPSEAAYQKVLELIPDANLSDQTQKFLTQNAHSKIRILNNPASFVPSPAIDEFIPKNSEHPFGKLHPEAPPETAQWGQLVGVWHCVNSVPTPSGQWISGWPATWAWRYILDGFAIQDIWMQDVKDFPPSNTLTHHMVGTNIRIFDRIKNKWDAIWFTNAQQPGGTVPATSQFEAEFKDGKITMVPVKEPAEGQPHRRIVFYNMKEDAFDWDSDLSNDGGKTWTTRSRIHATRLR